MTSLNLLFVDTETGGLDARRHALLSIGAVVVTTDLKTVVSSIEYKIKPNETLIVEHSALQVNKINLKEFQEEGWDEAAAIRSFKDWARQNSGVGGPDSAPMLIGWNLPFDIKFLKEAYKRSKIKWTFGYRTLDIQHLWAFYNLFQTSEGSTAYGGIKEAARIVLGKVVKHGALEDAMLTLDLLRNFVSDEE